MTMTITLFNGPFTRTRALVGGFVLLCSSFFFSALIFMCVVVDRGPRRSLATFTRFGELRFPLICLVVGCTMYCIYFVGIMVYFQGKLRQTIFYLFNLRIIFSKEKPSEGLRVKGHGKLAPIFSLNLYGCDYKFLVSLKTHSCFMF